MPIRPNQQLCHHLAGKPHGAGCLRKPGFHFAQDHRSPVYLLEREFTRPCAKSMM